MNPAARQRRPAVSWPRGWRCWPSAGGRATASGGGPPRADGRAGGASGSQGDGTTLGGAMSTLETAIRIAVTAHAGQTDKDGAAYITHPLRLMAAVDGED